jgi:protein-tyrosine phosphatase
MRTRYRVYQKGAIGAVIAILVIIISLSAHAQGERWIAIGGAKNFRDIGGYTAGDGIIRTGVVYRSDDLSRLEQLDIAKLADLEIKTVVDLRSEGVGGSMDISAFDKITVHHLPMERDELKNRAEFYRRIIVKSRKSLAELIIILSEEENLPLVMFDEEGAHEVEVATIVILASLGVARDDLVSDYLLSNQRGHDLQGEWGNCIVQYFEDYGGVEYYVTNILGISPDVIDSVKKNIIE